MSITVIRNTGYPGMLYALTISIDGKKSHNRSKRWGYS